MGKACAAWYVNDDRRFVKLAEVSILTFRKVMGEEAPDVVVLTDNPSLQIKGADRVINVREVLSASGVYDFPESKFGYLVWLKPLLPMIGELNGYDRLVMIDADIMFGTCMSNSAEAKRVLDMFFTEIYGDGVYFMAVEDMAKTMRQCKDRIEGDIERTSMRSAFPQDMLDKIGGRLATEYCNCGLIGVDLCSIRKDLVAYHKAVDFMLKCQSVMRLKYCEQDWLNMSFRFAVLPHETVWFFSTYDNELIRGTFTEKPIMHFTSRTGKRFMESLAKALGYLDGEGDGETEDGGKGRKRYCAVFCVDDSHLFQRLTEISIASFRKSYKECDCDVVVLTNDLNCKVRGGDKVVQVGGVLEKYGFTKERLVNTAYGKQYGVMAWTKLLIPMIAELNEYERVLVIDPDIIIKDERIAEFFTEGMEGRWFMGVHDCTAVKSTLRMRRSVERSYINGRYEWNNRLIDQCFGDGYCNTGLFAVDMTAIRRGITDYEDCIRFASHHLRNMGFRFADQDWLNYMFMFKVKPRSCMWFFGQDDVGKMGEAVAIHFVSMNGKAAMLRYAMHGNIEGNEDKTKKG